MRWTTIMSSYECYSQLSFNWLTLWSLDFNDNIQPKQLNRRLVIVSVFRILFCWQYFPQMLCSLSEECEPIFDLTKVEFKCWSTPTWIRSRVSGHSSAVWPPIILMNKLPKLTLKSGTTCRDQSGHNQHSQQQHPMLSPHNNPNLNHPLSPNASYGSVKGVSQPYSPPPSPTHTSLTSTASVQTPLLSGPEQTADPNWQAFKNSVRERNAAMFNNELMSDILFIVGLKGPNSGQQRIPAHKYVLATGSSVFYAMFYGGLAEEKTEIEIPDVEPSAFLTLLRSGLYKLHFLVTILEMTLNLNFKTIALEFDPFFSKGKHSLIL